MNSVISLSVIASGTFSVLCYFPKIGQHLLPNLHVKGSSKAQLFGILITGVFGVLAGLYSIFVNPIFGLNT